MYHNPENYGGCTADYSTYGKYTPLYIFWPDFSSSSVSLSTIIVLVRALD